MVNSQNSLVSVEKTIEDIIDYRRNESQYDINSAEITNSCRYAYSAPSATINDLRIERIPPHSNLWISDYELNNQSLDIDVGPTDSEITVVRIKREGLQFKAERSNWDMHDEAIPGDGTHLGESPSLVNLVTLVPRQSDNSTIRVRDEYLVPLSSWDPSDNPHEFQDIQSTMEANCTLLKTRISRKAVSDQECNSKKRIIKPHKSDSFARRIIKFFRSRLGKSKTLPSEGRE